MLSCAAGASVGQARGAHPTTPQRLATSAHVTQAMGQSAPGARPVHPLLQQRIDRITTAFAERSGLVLDSVHTAFVTQQNSMLTRVSLDQDACVGFVAIGIHGADNVDLAVHDASGVRLAEDHRPDPHPYVRICVRTGAELTVVATARDSAGPIALLTIANPPIVAPDLAAALGLHLEGGLTGPRTPRAPVAQDSATQTADESLSRLSVRLGQMGYDPVSDRTVGELQARTPVEHAQELGPAGCFGLQVATDTDSDGLRVELLDASGTVVGATRTPEAQPFVRGCLATGGRYTARLSSETGAHYAIQWFQHPDETQLSREYTGESRAGILELTSVASERHLSRRRFVEHVSTVGVAYARELSLLAGECVFIGAVGTATPIELSLLDDQNAVLASDTSGNHMPRIWACSTRTQTAHIVARPGTSRGDFVVLAMESSS